jgi:hypothetical protein
MVEVARRERRTLWLAGAAGLLLLLAVGAVVLLILLLTGGRSEVTAARDRARERQEAKTAQVTDMPDVRGRTYWLKMVPFQGGALAIGRSVKAEPPTFLALDSRGTPGAEGQLPNGPCDALELVAIGSSQAIALCANRSTIEFTGVTLDRTRLNARTLNGGAVPWSSTSMHHLFGSASGEHHFWAAPTGSGGWATACGHGLQPPIFTPLGGVTDISDLAALSDTEAVIVTVENGAGIKLLVVSDRGHVVRSALVAQGEPEDFAIARPRMFVGSATIFVVWLQRRPQPLLKSLAPDKTVLVFRRFSLALTPLGKAETLSEDPFVIPFSIEQTRAGGIISWDQGVRGSWDAASFVRISSEVGSSPGAKALRIPSGRLPTSMVETSAGVLALLSSGDSLASPYRTVLLTP